MPDPGTAVVIVVTSVLVALLVTPQLERRFDPRKLQTWLIALVIALTVLAVSFSVFLTTRS